MTLSESITNSLSEAKEPFKVGDFVLVQTGKLQNEIATVDSMNRSEDNKRWEVTVSSGRNTDVVPSSKLMKAPKYYASPEFIEVLGRAGFYDKYRKNTETVNKYRGKQLSPEEFNTELRKVKDGKKMFNLYKRSVLGGMPPQPSQWGIIDLYFDAVK